MYWQRFSEFVLWMVCGSLKWTLTFQSFLSVSLPAEHHLAASCLGKAALFVNVWWGQSCNFFTFFFSHHELLLYRYQVKLLYRGHSRNTKLERTTHCFNFSSVYFYAPKLFLKTFFCVNCWRVSKCSTAWLKKLGNLTTVIIWRETPLIPCLSPQLATVLFHTPQSICIRPLQRLGNACFLRVCSFSCLHTTLVWYGFDSEWPSYIFFVCYRNTCQRCGILTRLSEQTYYLTVAITSMMATLMAGSQMF